MSNMRLRYLWRWPNWLLGNHDRPRVAAKIGEAQARVARCCC